MGNSYGRLVETWHCKLKVRTINASLYICRKHAVNLKTGLHVNLQSSLFHTFLLNYFLTKHLYSGNDQINSVNLLIKTCDRNQGTHPYASFGALSGGSFSYKPSCSWGTDTCGSSVSSRASGLGGHVSYCCRSLGLPR